VNLLVQTQAEQSLCDKV